jgi:hypothetical protein
LGESPHKRFIIGRFAILKFFIDGVLQNDSELDDLADKIDAIGALKRGRCGATATALIIVLTLLTLLLLRTMVVLDHLIKFLNPLPRTRVLSEKRIHDLIPQSLTVHLDLRQ